MSNIRYWNYIDITITLLNINLRQNNDKLGEMEMGREPQFTILIQEQPRA